MGTQEVLYRHEGGAVAAKNNDLSLGEVGFLSLNTR